MRVYSSLTILFGSIIVRPARVLGADCVTEMAHKLMEAYGGNPENGCAITRNALIRKSAECPPMVST
jgi:hypothetical protein